MSDPLVYEEPGGSITVTPYALGRLVVRAVEQVDAARVRRPRRGLDVRFAAGRATVSVELVARYGAVLPELAGQAQERIAAALRETCDVDVDAVDVTVAEVER